MKLQCISVTHQRQGYWSYVADFMSIL